MGDLDQLAAAATPRGAIAPPVARPAPRPFVPEYDEEISHQSESVRLLAGFVTIVGALSLCVGGLALLMAVIAANRDGPPWSMSPMEIGILGIGLMFYGVLVLLAAAAVKLFAAMGLAMRDVARRAR